MNQVFHARDLAVGAIAKVALHLDDRRGDVDGLVGRDERHPLGHRGEGLLRAGSYAEAAADQHVVADDSAVARDGHQGQIVGVHIDAIVAGQADGGLELARQVGGAVDRLDLVTVRASAGERLFTCLAVGEPQLVVGRRAWAEMYGQSIGQRLHLGVDGILMMRGRAAHDIALDVAAGGQRRQLHLVDASDGFLEVTLQDAVQLQALPRRDPQRGIAQLIAQVELGQQLPAGQLAAGNLGADHEAVDFVAANAGSGTTAGRASRSSCW